MRKYFSERLLLNIGIIILLFAFFLGCEKDFDTVIDIGSDNYQVISVTGIKDTVDLKNPPDSLLDLRITFSPESKVSRVNFDVYASDNTILNPAPVIMNRVSSSNTFENRFILGNNNPIGNYRIIFTVTGVEGISKQAAVSNFYFNNGQDNLPPVISNTVVEPDTVIVTQPTVIFTSVEAEDPNGLNDIDEIYFIVYRPDGTTNNAKVFLLDDGDTQQHGDLIAGDGIFSRLIQVDENNAKGTYRFEFQAKDRSGELSNVLNHFVLIQ
jgi:hypothetical protein